MVDQTVHILQIGQSFLVQREHVYRRYALEHNLRTPQEDHNHLVQERHDVIREERKNQRLYEKRDTTKPTVLVLILHAHRQNAGDHAERLRHDTDILLFHVRHAAQNNQREGVPFAQLPANRIIYDDRARPFPL